MLFDLVPSKLSVLFRLLMFYVVPDTREHNYRSLNVGLPQMGVRARDCRGGEEFQQVQLVLDYTSVYCPFKTIEEDWGV